MKKKYIYCGVELTEEELKKLKECYSYDFCDMCNIPYCVAGEIYKRVDSTKYSIDDFISCLNLLEDF